MAYYAPQPAPYPASAPLLAAYPSAFAAPGPALPPAPADAPWTPPPPLPQQHSHVYAPVEPLLFDAAPRPCPLSCCAPIAPPPISTVPVYNVSYSLAGAMTPVDPPKPLQCAPAVPAQLQSPLCGMGPLWFGAETGSPSSGTPVYMQDVPSSSEEYFYEPETSSCSSLSPSPPPPLPHFVSVKKEELSPTSLSASGAPSVRERVAAKGRPRRDKSRTGSLILTGDQQYVCDICGVAFIRKHDGERHRRSHTGERPFPCHGGCGKAFRRADARSRHWGVYRECEWRHTVFLEGTPEGARRERRLLKRAKRAELVAQGVARPLIERILKKM